MAPLLLDGDVIAVDPSLPCTHEALVVATLDTGETVVRLLRETPQGATLAALQSGVAPVLLERSVQVYGRVVGMIRDL
jgi:SOS-response transcriptional repressor LexA